MNVGRGWLLAPSRLFRWNFTSNNASLNELWTHQMGKGWRSPVVAPNNVEGSDVRCLNSTAEGEGFEPSNPFGLPVFKTRKAGDDLQPDATICNCDGRSWGAWIAERCIPLHANWGRNGKRSFSPDPHVKRLPRSSESGIRETSDSVADRTLQRRRCSARRCRIQPPSRGAARRLQELGRSHP